MSSLDEITIKSKLIDYILSNQDCDNPDVLATEVPFADFQRRADLVRMNGLLHGYEIKSDLDNLNTLEGQITHYQSVFDKVSVVLTKTHIKNIRQMVPKTVGIIFVDSGNITVLRKAQLIKRADKYFLSCFLDRDTILQLLVAQGFEKRDLNTHDIAVLRRKLSSTYRIEELKAYTLEFLKQKYSQNFSYFLKYRGNVTHYENLIELSKGSDIIEQ